MLLRKGDVGAACLFSLGVHNTGIIGVWEHYVHMLSHDICVTVKFHFQLFISYTELLETKEKRQSHLNRFYSFVCTCGRCRREDERATGLLAAARVGVAEDVVENLVRDGLRRLSEDIGRMKKEESKLMVHFGMITSSPLPKIGRVWWTVVRNFSLQTPLSLVH